MTVHVCTIVQNDTGEIDRIYIGESRGALRRAMVADEKMWEGWDDPDWVEAALYMVSLEAVAEEFNERMHDSHTVEFHVVEVAK